MKRNRHTNFVTSKLFANRRYEDGQRKKLPKQQ